MSRLIALRAQAGWTIPNPGGVEAEEKRSSSATRGLRI